MKNIKNQNLIFSAVIERDKKGYVAECRELQGCYAQGKTYEEAIKSIKEVIEMHIDDRLEHGDFVVPYSDRSDVSITTFSFSAPSHVS